MCGIAGILYFDNKSGVEQALLDRMTGSLAHRGPDDRGTFIDGNVGLGFCRLSIIDLSQAGHQPMFNEDRTVYIICNGEIYNFHELRPKLEDKGHIFKSKTDIEVILHAYEEYGTDCLEHIDGMFSFAIWDSRKRQLFLARDRFGIKPLHYYHKNGIFAFGSEIKAILTIPHVSKDMDNQALWNYFSLMQVPAPQTIYKDIRKFLPSQAMVIKENGSHREWQYWDIKIGEDNSKKEHEWIEELNILFENSIKSQLVADVPIGCFLSGGVDSSAIVAFATRIKQEPVKTYSISFIDDGEEFDESPMQKIIADRFKTDHHEIRVKPDMLNAVDLLIKECDEPFAVPSAVGLYFVSKLASKEVKVVLSGDGGDELFAGYVTRYDRDRLFDWSRLLPANAKKALKHMSQLIPIEASKNSSLRKMRYFLEFSSMTDVERYICMLGIYSLESKMTIFNRDFLNEIDKDMINDYYFNAWNDFKLNKLNKRLYYDIKTSLSDEMLTKMDRCTSMVSIEGRVPFLDRKFAECAMKIPIEFKYSHNNGKKIFKKLIKGLVPEDILCSRKQGFNVPVNSWLAKDHGDISYNKNLFNIEYINKLRKIYTSNNKRFGYHFWILKCFSVWENLQKT
jgi:asparagine synthase (glutamine-hydrolysing)